MLTIGVTFEKSRSFLFILISIFLVFSLFVILLLSLSINCLVKDDKTPFWIGGWVKRRRSFWNKGWGIKFAASFSVSSFCLLIAGIDKSSSFIFSSLILSLERLFISVSFNIKLDIFWALFESFSLCLSLSLSLSLNFNPSNFLILCWKPCCLKILLKKPSELDLSSFDLSSLDFIVLSLFLYSDLIVVKNPPRLENIDNFVELFFWMLLFNFVFISFKYFCISIFCISCWYLTNNFGSNSYPYVTKSLIS